MGQTVLTNKFVSGLRPNIKTRGTDGTFEQLLVKARFEEAKKRELNALRATQPPKKPASNHPQTTQPQNGLSDSKNQSNAQFKVVAPNLNAGTAVGCMAIESEGAPIHDNKNLIERHTVGNRLRSLLSLHWVM